jgi:hypothetical protein
MDSNTMKNIKNKKKSKKSRKNATRKKLKYIESLGGAILPSIPPRTYLRKQQSDEPLSPSTVVEPASQIKEIQQQEQQVDALATILPIQNEVNTEIQEIPVATDANAGAGDAQPAVSTTEVTDASAIANAGVQQPEVSTTEVTDANAIANPGVQQPEVSTDAIENANANANTSGEQTDVPVEEATDANAIANAGVQQPEVSTDAIENANASGLQVEPKVEEEKEDPIKAVLLEQLKQIEEKTNEIKSKLMTSENAAAAGGGLNKILKKRKKTFYKKYKSKISMKRRNKTSRNNK